MAPRMGDVMAAVNENGQTFAAFLKEVEAAGWPTDDADQWLGYWEDGYTVSEALWDQAGDLVDEEEARA